MRLGLAIAALLVASVSAQRTGVFDQSINHPAIKYSTSDSTTVVDALNRKLRDGSVKLVHEGKSGYLRSVLQLLDIPIESQVLVYTQTSLQARHITMQNPRAIYFNDVAAVGFVRGGPLLEIVAQDPVLGSVFYTIDQQGTASPAFGRDQQCLRCHLSWDTLGVPGLSVLSTFPRASERDYANGFFVDHYRPIRERWGGWYVTGRRVPPHHMGNLPLILPTPPAAPPGGRVSLEGQFDLDGYPTPYSDIVALMVLEHQVHFSNLVTRATWESRVARGPHDADSASWSGGDPMRVAEAAETLADYLLFVDEAPITEGPIAGSSGFAEVFVARGKKDPKGRSLRELDLKTRLQKYPLSYMIYSPQFQALPEAAKNLVMARIRGVLSGEITSQKYAHLTPGLRAAIREILAATL